MVDSRVERKKETLKKKKKKKETLSGDSVLKPLNQPSLVSHLCTGSHTSNIVLLVYSSWDRGLWDLQPGASRTEAHFLVLEHPRTPLPLVRCHSRFLNVSASS